MSYIEQGPDLLEHARRGAGIIKAARAGGVSKARGKRREIEEHDAATRQRAKELRKAHPDWSVSSVAKRLEKEGLGKARTIRRKIADLKPTTN